MPTLVAHLPLELLAFVPAALVLIVASVRERRVAAARRHDETPASTVPPTTR
jgi:hypothetical protein